MGDNSGKLELIPHTPYGGKRGIVLIRAFEVLLALVKETIEGFYLDDLALLDEPKSD